MKLPPRDESKEAARVATRAALERAGYKFPDEIVIAIGLEWKFGADHHVIELRIAQERPEDSILLTRAKVGPTLDDVTVEVFHDTLAALGVPRVIPDAQAD